MILKASTVRQTKFRLLARSAMRLGVSATSVLYSFPLPLSFADVTISTLSISTASLGGSRRVMSALWIIASGNCKSTFSSLDPAQPPFSTRSSDMVGDRSPSEVVVPLADCRLDPSYFFTPSVSYGTLSEFTLRSICLKICRVSKYKAVLNTVPDISFLPLPNIGS